MRTRTTLTLMLATAASLAGAQAGRRDTVVKTVAAPVHARAGTLVEEASIGVVDGAEEYMFGEIADIALGRDGALFVYDRRVPIVRQYDAAGKHIRNIGRSGSGPGEYRSVSGLAVMKDGRLLVWDTGNWRINVYSPAGQPAGQWATPSGSANSTATYSRAIMVDSAGQVWCRGNVLARSGGSISRRTVWYRVDERGIRDTVEQPPMPDVQEGLVATSPQGNATSSAVVPFTPVPYVTRSPLGYFVTGYPNRYAVDLVAPDKPVTSIRRANVAAPLVAEAERKDERERIETMLRRTQPGWTWNGPEIPGTKPHYGGISVGLDGRIWVAVVPEVTPRVGSMSTPVGVSGAGGGGAPARAPTRAPRDPKPALYDVFEPDGRYVGQVNIPPRVATAVRNGDQVWAIAYNDDDVAFVKRYRVRWP